ncbi:MAG: hypothetical protein DCC68_09175 [Planctomycetota bacterium]|nr:MAG: hypothetical protein DCC68_09175 [Planctomycetota bacterium]
MVTTTLVEANVKLGESVYDAIRHDGMLGVQGALWWFDPDASEWRYLVVARGYDRRGPRAAYSRLQSILKKAGLLDQLPLVRVVVVSPNHRIPVALRKLIDASQTPPPMHVPLDNVTIPGMHVDAAYIYDI